MMICSIDLMGGKAVQLRQGKEHVLTSDVDPLELVQAFNRYGEVAVIDLDAALGVGDNLALIKKMCRLGDIRVGGGIRDDERADVLLRAGAKKLIIGTSATPEFLAKLPKDKVMVAVDHQHGKVVDKGWTHETDETVLERANRLAPFCSGYLCTFVETEGGMTGMPLDEVQALVSEMPHPTTVAGGVATTAEMITLSRMGLDVQVGMALYTGKLDPVEAVVETLEWEKMKGQIPTIVQDKSGQVLMLAYSTKDSFRAALKNGKGIYYSRSRKELWEKGNTSGNAQRLISSRMDCDRDTLLWTVEQTGPACHRETYTCFGERQFSPEMLFDQLKQRKETMPEGSFSAKLFQNRKLLNKKILEEAYEVVSYDSWENLRWEIGDLLYFASVLAVDEGVSWQDLMGELGGRHK